ncbi:hypothetical protein I8J29_08565 [Paenibacillus sp. MWE-103]|uniref:Uncharacterized protein n=1 Tax=Paenibacillus artemisiicola TaxID=1172618 RepID=A0ABS3W7E4_9BACL|nr:hypothetical protein [Paenibacillus artemisiicola]MBO7744244.1 hypothetical protein [Paenibacillus artemisiicola]
MAYGIYAFKDRSSAQQFIDEQKTGKLMTASELAKHSWAQNMDQMNNMSDMGGEHDENAHGEMDMGGNAERDEAGA